MKSVPKVIVPVAPEIDGVPPVVTSVVPSWTLRFDMSPFTRPTTPVRGRTTSSTVTVDWLLLVSRKRKRGTFARDGVPSSWSVSCPERCWARNTVWSAVWVALAATEPLMVPDARVKFAEPTETVRVSPNARLPASPMTV